MKIQLAHFRNGLCTRNKISKTGWKTRTYHGIAKHLPMTFSQWFCIVKRRVESCSSLKKQTCALAVCLFETVSFYIHYN